MDEVETTRRWLYGNTAGMVELQRLLTAIPALAPESGGAGEEKKCAALQSWLASRGIRRLERFDAPDARVPSGFRPNLTALIPGKSERALWIISHLDVVPEGERSLWHSNPWEAVEKDGKLFGRGTEDNQQAIAAGAFAALALTEAGVTPALTLKLLFAADEENGSDYGIKWLLEHHKGLFRADDLIAVPDGGDPGGEGIEVAEKGLLWLRLRTSGVQAHASMPDAGKNAFLAASALALRLHALETRFDATDALFSLPRSTFQPTRKEANIPNINTIPGEDVFYMDCRVLPRYPLADVLEAVRGEARAVEREYGVRIECGTVQASESPATAPDAPIVRALQRGARRVYGADAQPIGIGGGTVAAPLRREGFAAAVWSRIENRAHQPDEFCVIDNMAGDAAVFAGIALNPEA